MNCSQNSMQKVRKHFKSVFDSSVPSALWCCHLGKKSCSSNHEKVHFGDWSR